MQSDGFAHVALEEQHYDFRRKKSGGWSKKKCLVYCVFSSLGFGFFVLFLFCFFFGGLTLQMHSENATLLLFLANCQCLVGWIPGRKSAAEEFYAREGDDPTKLCDAHLKVQNIHTKTFFSL